MVPVVILVLNILQQTSYSRSTMSVPIENPYTTSH